MLDMNFKELVESKRLYYIPCGGGGIIGSSADDVTKNTALNSLIMSVHSVADLKCLTEFELENERIQFSYEVELTLGFRNVKKVVVRKSIRIHRVTFEEYEQQS